MLLGAMGSLAASFRFAERDYPARAARAAAPWALLVVILAIVRAVDAGAAHGHARAGVRG